MGTYLHRRHPTAEGHGPVLMDPNPKSQSRSPRINTAYVPLNSPSYGARRSPSDPLQPVLSPTMYTGPTQNGAFEMTYDLGERNEGARTMGWWATVKAGSSGVQKGLRDSLKLTRSLDLVWNDRELRTLVLKSTLINLVSLLLLSLSSVIFSPLLVHPISPTMESRTREISLWYNLLLSWPVFIVCFWVNASWGPDISRRAQSLLHPTNRYQPSPSSTPTSSTSRPATQSSKAMAAVFSSIARVLLIGDFTLLSRTIGLVPFVGRIGATAYMCVINAYYCFEWTFSMGQIPLDERIAYVQDRVGYMFAFGFPATLLTSFGPPLVNMAIFSLIYPFFVIQALQSRPPSRQRSILPSTPPPQALHNAASSTRPSGYFSQSTSLMSSVQKWELRLPIFFLASYALDGLRWLEDAVGRDRRGKPGLIGLGIRERPGKRLG